MGLCRVWLLRADLGGPVSQSSRLLLYSWSFRAAFLIALLPPPSCMNSFQWDYVCGLSSHQWGQLPRELNECQRPLPAAFWGVWSPSDFFCVSLSDQCGPLSSPHDCFCLLPALLPFSLKKNGSQYHLCQLTCDDLVRRFLLQKTNLNV